MEGHVEARISALEGEIVAIRADMEGACREFLRATMELAVAWFQQRIEQTVVGNPELAKLLGREELRRLKQELRRLIDQAPELVSSHVNRDRYWAHRPVLMDSSTALFNPAVNPYGFRGDEPPPLLDGAVTEVLRRADALLEEFGFITASRPPRLPTVPAGRPKRHLTFEWSEPMKATLARYAALYQRLRVANGELRPLRRKRTDSDAKRLWDEV